MDISDTIALLGLCLTCITVGYKIGKDIWKKMTATPDK